jgi:sigma-B regulation protein RsbU (phosphoserine phosphatase)
MEATDREATDQVVLRRQLVERRQKLEGALPRLREREPVLELLREVDAALERIERGTFGFCEACQGAIEADRLRADPLTRFCLDDLSPSQARALEQDLESAARVQRGLLPRPGIRRAGWHVEYHYEPAGVVSGDYCDVLDSGQKDGLLFFLGDVSGKGVAASMLMAHLHAMFRSLLGFELGVGQLVERANRLFCESTMDSRYATLACGLAGASGELEVCIAGHCPLLLASRGDMTTLPATGVPLGLFREARYETRTLRLRPGDTLFLYTDGLSEAPDGSDAEYGLERLTRTVAGSDSLSPAALLSACRDDVAAFQAGASRTDDMTIMVVRRLGEQGN